MRIESVCLDILSPFHSACGSACNYAPRHRMPAEGLTELSETAHPHCAGLVHRFSIVCVQQISEQTVNCTGLCQVAGVRNTCENVHFRVSPSDASAVHQCDAADSPLIDRRTQWGPLSAAVEKGTVCSVALVHTGIVLVTTGRMLVDTADRWMMAPFF